MACASANSLWSHTSDRQLAGSAGSTYCLRVSSGSGPLLAPATTSLGLEAAPIHLSLGYGSRKVPNAFRKYCKIWTQNFLPTHQVSKREPLFLWESSLLEEEVTGEGATEYTYGVPNPSWRLLIKIEHARGRYKTVCTQISKVGKYEG